MKEDQSVSISLALSPAMFQDIIFNEGFEFVSLERNGTFLGRAIAILVQALFIGTVCNGWEVKGLEGVGDFNKGKEKDEEEIEGGVVLN